MSFIITKYLVFCYSSTNGRKHRSFIYTLILDIYCRLTASPVLYTRNYNEHDWQGPCSLGAHALGGNEMANIQHNENMNHETEQPGRELLFLIGGSGMVSLALERQ